MPIFLKPRKNRFWRSRPGAGFTLMEMIIVIAIFSSLILMITDVFILSLQSQKQTAFRQQTLANLRYIMETMAQKIRTTEINYRYGGYPGGVINSPVNSLALTDEAGANYLYALLGGKIYLLTQGVLSPLTDPKEVIVTKLAFYVSPKTSPFREERCNAALETSGCQPGIDCTINDINLGAIGFCLCDSGADPNSNCATKNCDLGSGVCQPFNQQLRVTIVLGFQSAGVKPQEQKTIYLQTTVSSRVYKR